MCILTNNKQRLMRYVIVERVNLYLKFEIKFFNFYLDIRKK